MPRRASGGASARRERARGACSRARARRLPRPRRPVRPRRCPRLPARAWRRAAGRGGAAGGDDLGRALGRLVDVRAGEVQLDRSTSSSAAQVSAYSPPENPPTETHSGTPSSRSARQGLCEEALAARVREPDRVQHPGVGLGDPDGWVSLARLGRDRLRHEGVERAGDLGGGQRVEAAGSVKQHRAPVLRRRGA